LGRSPRIFIRWVIGTILAWVGPAELPLGGCGQVAAEG